MRQNDKPWVVEIRKVATIMIEKPLSLSHSREIHAQAKILHALISGQPLTFAELVAETRVHKSVLYRHLPIMLKHGLVRTIKKGERKLSQQEFALASYTDLEVDVENAFKRFRSEDYGQVTLEHVASYAGRPIIEAFKKIAFKMARKYEVPIGKVEFQGGQLIG